jgi:hypothetical protein
MKAINRRIEKLSTIKDQALLNARRQCIGLLEESKKGIAQFYGAEKQ